MAYKISDDCIACGACEAECPVSAISEGDGKYEINPDLCTECGSCADVCRARHTGRPQRFTGTCNLSSLFGRSGRLFHRIDLRL